MTKRQQKKQVVEMIRSLTAAFEDAYKQRKRGATEEGLMIQVDIFAANWIATHPRSPESVAIAHRRAVTSGIEAADAGVPLYLASSIIRQHLNASAAEILRQCAN